jgi:transcriptional regulator
MYLPKHFEETDTAVLHALIAAHPLGTLVTQHEGNLVADHIPFLIDPARGEHGTLLAHVARANPVWKTLLANTSESLVIFQGPQAYISPSWYPSKYEHGKAVPTWNYAVVHAHGVARAIDDPNWLLPFVTRLTNIHEATNVATEAVPWQVSDAPPDYIDSMIKAIVGIEIPLTKLVGKWKVSQNRPEPDKLGVIAGLTGRAGENALQMAQLVKMRLR